MYSACHIHINIGPLTRLGGLALLTNNPFLCISHFIVQAASNSVCQIIHYTAAFFRHSINMCIKNVHLCIGKAQLNIHIYLLQTALQNGSEEPERTLQNE